MRIRRRRGAGAAGRRAARRLLPLLAGSALVAGCDHPFEPFQENTLGPFSVFGYLDLNADVQWVRVMPIRQTLLAEPGPIDAVVTLEHLGTGRVVTLRDSLFAYTDHGMGAVAYAVVWQWRADWHGSYHFQAIVPGSELLLEFPGHPDQALSIPPLGAGERYVAPDVTLPSSC
jgi:hypothetical protein